jgi:hypothetical protein
LERGWNTAVAFVRNISHHNNFPAGSFWDLPDFRFPVWMKKIPGQQNALNGIISFLINMPVLGMLV